MKVSRRNAEHYVWGQICDGWHLLKSENLSIIHEKMPPNTSEQRHHHLKSNQFFFILHGEATIEVDGEIFNLGVHEGIEVSSKVPHQMFNRSYNEIEFLVISNPNSKGDRVLD